MKENKEVLNREWYQSQIETFIDQSAELGKKTPWEGSLKRINAQPILTTHAETLASSILDRHYVYFRKGPNVYNRNSSLVSINIKNLKDHKVTTRALYLIINPYGERVKNPSSLSLIMQNGIQLINFISDIKNKDDIFEPTIDDLRDIYEFTSNKGIVPLS